MKRDSFITEADSYLCVHRGLLSTEQENEYLRLLEEERAMPEPEEGEEETPVSLDLLKLYKALQLLVYDASDAVNSFSIGGHSLWLSPSQRANYLLTIEAAQEAGVESVPFEGANLPVATALAALKAINLYAMQCVAVTNAHAAAIAELGSEADIARYDFTVGYPAKLAF